MATCHPDRPAKSGTLCQSCYRAQLKAKKLAEGAIRVDEEKGTEVGTGAPVERDLVNDPAAVREFYKILWGWLLAAQKAQEPVLDEDGNIDWRLTARLREGTANLGMKSATVLGRAYIAERRIEEKPEELPVSGLGDVAAGWKQVSEIKKPSFAPGSPLANAKEEFNA